MTVQAAGRDFADINNRDVRPDAQDIADEAVVMAGDMKGTEKSTFQAGMAVKDLNWITELLGLLTGRYKALGNLVRLGTG